LRDLLDALAVLGRLEAFGHVVEAVLLFGREVLQVLQSEAQGFDRGLGGEHFGFDFGAALLVHGVVLYLLVEKILL
jgi:hypothetical protein